MSRSTHGDVENSGAAAVAVVADDLAVAHYFDRDGAFAAGFFDHAFQAGAADFAVLGHDAAEGHLDDAVGGPQLATSFESQAIGAGDREDEFAGFGVAGVR